MENGGLGRLNSTPYIGTVGLKGIGTEGECRMLAIPATSSFVFLLYYVCTCIAWQLVPTPAAPYVIGRLSDGEPLFSPLWKVGLPRRRSGTFEAARSVEGHEGHEEHHAAVLGSGAFTCIECYAFSNVLSTCSPFESFG